MADADLSSLSDTSGPLEKYPPVPLESFRLAANVGFEGRDIRSRPFKLLRTQLTKLLAWRQARLIGITSAAPAAGKSFLSLNLAASLAQVSEHPVYLVDLDLRRASLAEQLGLTVETGIDAFLRGEASRLEDLGRRLEGSPLIVFPTNRVNSGSEEHVAGPHFARLIQLLREDAGDSIVLFDLPPVFASDDAMICIEALDGYVMIVDSGKTSRRQLTEAIEMLRPSPFLGSVLNRYKGGLLDSYGYYSHAYDRYYAG
jgi:Mrp family chromosome partitioning ATPase